MKYSLLNKSRKDLSDYEKLIEDGYVLDVRGQWIPLNEKVKKERAFVKHLEAGEVLISGKWIHVSDAVKTDKDSPDFIAVHDAPVLDETVQMSAHFNHEVSEPIHTRNEETHASLNPSTNNTEPDFPPETIMIPVDELLKKANYQNQSEHEKTDNINLFDSKNPFPEDSEISQETIAIPLSTIPFISSSKTETPGNRTQFTSGWEHTHQNRRRTLLKVSLTIIIIGIAAFALFAFTNGLILFN